MGYWKSKVLPKLKKAFDINSSKKAAAAEACKSFDDSKEEVNKEFEEKKTELQPKVVEIYEASSTEIKALVKERKDEGIKKNSPAVQKFLEELVKIEFPGSKQVSEASSKFGPVLVSGPVLFVFEKVSTFVVTQEETKEGESTAASAEETSGEVKDQKEKEVVAVVEGAEKEEEEKIKDTVAEEVVVKEKTEPAAKVAEEEAPKA